MKLCVNQSNDESRYSVNSPALFEYEETTYNPCSVSYANEVNNMRSMSNELQQQNCLIQTNSNLTQVAINSHYNQTHSPASIESIAGHGTPGTFTPSPSRGFDYPTSPSTKPSIPANTDYPGEFDFQIDFGELTEYAPKSAQYTYSKSLNKLFVKMSVTCPIRFKCAARLPPAGCLIRAIPVFKRPEHVTDIVTRCPNHKIPDEVHYIPNGHLIRAEGTNDCHVNYNVASDGRESVTVLYERPQVGAEYTTVLYKFMCLSSCVGGINRRPLLTCFTLEKDGQVLGRRVVEVRICSCPGRDRSQEERRKKANKSDPNFTYGSLSSRNSFKFINGKIHNILESSHVGGNKRRRLNQGGANLNDQDTGDFILRVRGKEKFELLRKMKEALDLMDLISPSQIEAYRSHDNEEHANLFRQIKPSTPEARRFNVDGSSVMKSNFSVSEPLSVTSQNPPANHNAPIFQSHSSPSLTTTPTGASPISCPTSVVSSCSSGSYWGFVDSLQLGCDVPDVSLPNKDSWLENLQNSLPDSNNRNTKVLDTRNHQSDPRVLSYAPSSVSSSIPRVEGSHKGGSGELFNVTYLRNMDGIGPDASIKRESREEYSKSSHSNLQNIGIGSSLTQQLL